MTWRRHELEGRHAELDALRAHAEGPALLVVRGPSGSGRSALLRRFAADARADGRVVLTIDGRAEPWDEFRARPLLTAVRAEYEAFGGVPRVTEAIEALRRLAVPASYATPGERHRLLGTVSALLTRISERVRLLVVVDDADGVPAVAVAPAHRAGHTVVVACGSSAPRELCSLADRIVDLRPLADDAADRLLCQVAGGPVDDAVPRALRAHLGPLHGDAGTLVSTVAALRAEGRLVKVHGVVALRAPDEPIALPAGHHLRAELDALGDVGRELVLLAAGTPEFRVDLVPALAAATGRPAHEYGAAVDRLVLAGALVHEANGRVRCPSPAVAASVTGTVTGPHRAIAEALAATRPSAATGHVVAAGRALPAATEWAALLGDERGPGEPAADRTARRLAAWWHAPASGLRSELVRELVAAGDYERLAAFVADVAAQPGDAATDAGELATAAALAALHLDRPVPVAVRAAVTGPSAPDTASVVAGVETGPIALADRWLAGEHVPVAEFRAAFGPFLRRSPVPTIGGRGPAPSAVPVEDACALRDLVPVFRAVLGSRYRPPARGPVAAYHRVCRGYADGDWGDALSAARELTLSAEVDGALRDAAALLAAEICGWRGEDRQAAAWLAAVPADTAFPALRGWVATGLRDHADGRDAFSTGWAWYTEHADRVEEPGAARLLTRLASIAVDAGERHRAHAVLRAVVARYGPASDTELLVRGLVEADGLGMRTAAGMIRRRGTRFELAFVCQRVAGLTGEPRPWLSEAYELASSIGAAKLLSTTKRAMAGHGVTVPTHRARHTDVSDVERRIVELIRAGKTNRQIAVALRVSAKTVEKHLTRLFAKAGCRTRHGLATSGLGARQELVGA